MNDDRSNNGKPDRDRIDLHEPGDLRDWVLKLGVDGGTIKEAVARVGPMVIDVKRYLGKFK